MIEKVNPSHPDKDFNSMMVQLKPYKDFKEIRKRLFQFHNGTIKTFGSRDYRSVQQQFQFQYGTIKTNSLNIRYRV